MMMMRMMLMMMMLLLMMMMMMISRCKCWLTLQLVVFRPQDCVLDKGAMLAQAAVACVSAQDCVLENAK